MNNNKTSFTKKVDVQAFENMRGVDPNSLEAMILKVRQSKVFAKLEDWIQHYPVEDGVKPSKLSPVACMAKIVSMAPTVKNIHPAHQADMIVGTHDVVFSNVGAVYEEKGVPKTLGVNMAYLLPNVKDSLRIIHASTAEIAATDAKFDKQGNLNPPTWPENFAVSRTEAAIVRDALNNTTSSRSKARDQMFLTLMTKDNMVPSVIFHSEMGEGLPNWTENLAFTEVVKKWYVAHKIRTDRKLQVKLIGIDSGPVPSTSDVNEAYKYYFASNAIRAGRNGKGLSHGFERFAMSRVMSNVLNLVTDFLNMAELYGTKVVTIRDTTFLTTEEMRVLVANGFRVCQTSSLKETCTVKSDPGVYGGVASDVCHFEFLVLGEAGIAPNYSNGLITLGKNYAHTLNTLLGKKRTFAYVYIDTSLKSVKGAGLLPSATADTMQIICATDVKKTYPLKDLVQRATMATSCRNRFLHSRKPFWTMDIMGGFVKWEQEIKYPAMRVLESGKLIELSGGKFNANLHVTPMDVDAANLTKIATEVEPSEDKIANELIAAYENDATQVCIALYGGGGQFLDDIDPYPDWKDTVYKLRERDYKQILRRHFSDFDAVYDAAIRDIPFAAGDSNDATDSAEEDDDDSQDGGVGPRTIELGEEFEIDISANRV